MRSTSPDYIDQDDDDEVNVVDAEGSPYTFNKSKMTTNISSSRRDDLRTTASRSGMIETPGAGTTQRRPPNILTPNYGPQVSKSFQTKEDAFSPRTRRANSLNSINGTSRQWGDPPPFVPGGKVDPTMKGIKAPVNRQVTGRNDMYKEDDGKYHLVLKESGAKRPRQVIDIDSQDDDRPTSKQKVSHPGQKSRYFPVLNTVPANPLPTNALEREAASRGLPLQVPSTEPFATPFHKSPDLPNKLAEEFKNSNKASMMIPGGEPKRRGLTQPMGPSRFRFGAGTEMRHTGGTEVQLSWGVVDGVRYSDLYVRIGDEVRIYKRNMAERLVAFKVKEAALVQFWRIETADGRKYTLVLTDTDKDKGGLAFNSTFGGRVDQIDKAIFASKYMTGTNRPPQSTPKPKPPSQSPDFLNQTRELSTKKGALELSPPPPEPKKPRISTVTTRRISDVTTRTAATGNDDSRRQSAGMSTRRETRSQRALTKNDPYLEYPLNAKRNKITIYRDDLDRLKDDEFLNDTIIEFYLTYILDNLSETTRAKTHFFNTFFWTNLTKKNANGKRGHENVKKWTSKVDLFSKKYVIVPINESAHWYVAIICNLDNAKSRTATPQKVVTRTRTRSQLDKTTPEPIDIDMAMDIDISPPESITPPIPSRHATPAIAIDEERPNDVTELLRALSSSAAVANTDDIVMASGADDVIDVDDPTAGSTSIAQHFRRMSISSHRDLSPAPSAHPENGGKYHYTTDPNIDIATLQEIRTALEEEKPPLTRYTRSTTTIKPSIEISLDEEDEEPVSISSALKQKYNPAPSAPPASRRSSGKIVPLDSPVIIVFDSLGLRHVGTIKLLREYLVEEAKSKRQIDLPKEDVSGLHAKVPKQSNYCDCGVFLLHYVEKFLHDPDRYLPDILNRVHDSTEPEITQELWRSGEVKEKRQQIHELIENLHLASYLEDMDRRKATEQAKKQQEQQQQQEKETQRLKEEKEVQRRKEEDVEKRSFGWGRNGGMKKGGGGKMDVVEIDD